MPWMSQSGRQAGVWQMSEGMTYDGRGLYERVIGGGDRGE